MAVPRREWSGQAFDIFVGAAPPPRYLSAYSGIWNFAARALRVAIHANYSIAKRYLITFRSYNNLLRGEIDLAIGGSVAVPRREWSGKTFDIFVGGAPPPRFLSFWSEVWNIAARAPLIWTSPVCQDKKRRVSDNDSWEPVRELENQQIPENLLLVNQQVKISNLRKNRSRTTSWP